MGSESNKDINKWHDYSVSQYYNEYQENMKKICPSLRPFFSDLYNRYIHAEDDSEYYRAIIRGDWPNAGQIFKNAQKKDSK